MQNQIIKNLRIYIQWIPFLGIIIGIFVFVYATFVKHSDPLLALIYGFTLFAVHILFWMSARLILRKMDNDES